MTTATVTPVVSTTKVASKPEQSINTWVNSEAISESAIDKALYDGFQLQSQYENETDFRVDYILTAIEKANKQSAREAVQLYSRTIDAWQKLPKYKATHTRDQVEAEFLKTRDGKVAQQMAKMGAEYLEDHK